jgi:hypothetical protein
MVTSVPVLGNIKIAVQQSVWSYTPVAKRIERIQQTESVVFNERLFLGDIARHNLADLRVSYLRLCALTFAWGALFLLFATMWCAVKGVAYQPPLACFISVLGVLVVFLLKLHNAKEEA